MEWTKGAPGCNGFYWLRSYRIEGDTGISERPVVVYVYSSFGEPFEVTFTGNDSSFSVGEVAEGEWCGPLLPPSP